MTTTVSRLRAVVVAAKERLAQGRQRLRRQHEAGSPGVQVCTLLTDLLDGVILDLFEGVQSELEGKALDAATQVALVAHGGFGRRDMAPYSDVDLMLLVQPKVEKDVEPLARKLSQAIFDCGLQLGFSVRTPQQACQFARTDATICTTLAEARLLVGSVKLFTNFATRFRRLVKSKARPLITAIEKARRDEWKQHGGTVNLLEPNVKRSRGGLRDIQLVRWVGFIAYQESEPEALHRAGHLSKIDYQRLRDARDFLLRLRNELHFEAGKAHDLLDKSEQLRVAEKFHYPGDAAILPVERFMREYFEHTNEVRNVAAHALATALPGSALANTLHPWVSHLVEGDFRVGPQYIKATPRGLKKVTSDLEQVLRLMGLANLYSKRIHHDTWEAIRAAMTARQDLIVTPAAIERFLDLMSQPGPVGDQLRRLHELRVLEKLVPAMTHARCLLQFNEYHKYTVDEHSIRAVQAATEFMTDQGPLGDAYRSLANKRTLHLALLLHDMGKGFVEDHSEVGARIAAEMAQTLCLPLREAQTLEFLVHKHLVMSHLAFRRDLNDEQVVVRFAVEVGSPEALQMLFLVTAADLAAVGPGVLNQWKLELLTELYRRTMRYLAGDTPGSGSGALALAHKRDELRVMVKDVRQRAWWDKQLETLPGWYLFGGPPERLYPQLDELRQLPHNNAIAWGRFDSDRSAVEYTIGTYEEITPGIFHKLTGALSSKGLQILSASIATLADGLVLDRFYVTDADFSGEPPQGRIDEVCAALVAALRDTTNKPPTFRKLWQTKPKLTAPAAGVAPTEVRIDNGTSERYTILDIFAHDRMGLLYTITRAVFELGLSVHVAKIATFVDQVLDVFYVTDQAGQKITDEHRLEEIRARLLAAIAE
jgi:[protein-PII] uridylyltransferase